MNKNYLLYIGIFLAGAIITPMYLSVFNGDDGGDRPKADGESSDEINLDLTANSDSFSANQDSGKVFVPNDSQEVILNDYPTVESKPVPTGLPEFARNQPPVTPYPNYGSPRIPSFTTTQPKPNAASSQAPSGVQSPSVTVKPQVTSRATSPASGLFQSMPAKVFTPPQNMPDPNAAASPSFGGNFQVSDDFDLKNFTGGSTKPLQSDGATNSESP
jgi:hypothetical protein